MYPVNIMISYGMSFQTLSDSFSQFNVFFNDTSACVIYFSGCHGVFCKGMLGEVQSGSRRTADVY